MNILPNSVLTASIVILGILASNAVTAAKLYKWVDKDGKVSYQDSPPPNNANVKDQTTIVTPSSPSEGNTSSDQPSVPVMVYTTTNCALCELLLSKLQKWGVPAEEGSILNREVQSKILSLTDGLSAPTLFIDDKLISDLSESNLTIELESVGFKLSKEAPNTSQEEPEVETNGVD